MPPLMVFDNDCVLCSRLVRFILKYEQNDMLHFVAAWSDEGKSLAENYSFTQADLNQSFLLIENEYAYTHSDAGLKLLSYLKAPWSYLSIFRLIPRVLRDAVYTVIAKNRYQWFGRQKNCVTIPVSHKHRFINSS